MLKFQLDKLGVIYKFANKKSSGGLKYENS